VNHGLETIDLDSFIEGPFDSDIFYDLEGEGFSGGGVGRLDLVGFGLAADGRDYGVAVLEEDFEDVGGDESASTCLFMSVSVGKYFLCCGCVETCGGLGRGDSGVMEG